MSVVLVTGAGGFVGSAVVRRLVLGDALLWDGTRVEHVVALLRPGGSEERLEALRRDERWSIEHADLSDASSLARVMRHTRPAAVVHTALDARAYEDVDDVRVRAPLEALIDGLRGRRAQRFVHAGSAWVLGPGESLDESAVIDPRTPYARNKARQDALLADRAASAGVPWINLRLFNLFGRYEKTSRLLPTLVSRLEGGDDVELSHGDQIRDFTDVDVAAEAFARALAIDGDACGTVYHIGSGRGTSVRALALMVALRFGSHDRIRFGTSTSYDEHLPVLVADPARARRVLGWQPDLDLETRVQEAVDWWLDRRARQPRDAVTA